MKITPGAGGADASGGAEPLREASVAEERWLLCAACGGRITPERARIDVDGTHEHEFMNPSGLRFRVACYATAPGCMPEGERSTVWTWFPGHAWQIEICKACATHVGWSFHGSASSFYGLVRDRLA